MGRSLKFIPFIKYAIFLANLRVALNANYSSANSDIIRYNYLNYNLFCVSL